MRTIVSNISISCFLFFNTAIAQVDSNKIFLQSKGLLEYPINTTIEVKDMSLGQGFYGDFPEQKVTFSSDTSAKINCIFDGQVCTVAKIEDMYVVITEFGDYCLCYSNLSEPLIKKGDFIKAGQTIAYLQKDFNDIFSVDIYIFTKGKMISPYSWFKKLNNNKDCKGLLQQYE